LNEAETQISRLEVTRKSLGGDQARLQAALLEKDSEIKVKKHRPLLAVKFGKWGL